MQVTRVRIAQFVGIVVIGCVAALVSAAAIRYYRFDRTVRRIESYGGFVSIEQPLNGQLSRLGLYGFRLPSVLLHAVHLNRPWIDDRVVAGFDWPRCLEHLDLSGSAVKGLCLAELPNRQHLHELRLDGSAMRDDNLKHIAAFGSLRGLGLSRTGISDTALQYIASIRSLQWLELSDTAIGDEGIQALGDLPNLNGLSLDRTRITDRGIKSLAAFRALRQVSLSGTEITDAAISTLSEIRELEFLDLSTTRIAGVGLSRLKSLQKLHKLRLRKLALVSEALDAVGEMESIRELCLTDSSADDSQIRKLRGCYEVLDLSGTSVSDAGLGHLQTIKELQILLLRGSRVTEDGVAEFRRKRPHVLILK